LLLHRPIIIVLKYEKERTAAAIARYVSQHSVPPYTSSTPITSASDVASLMQESSTVIAGCALEGYAQELIDTSYNFQGMYACVFFYGQHSGEICCHVLDLLSFFLAHTCKLKSSALLFLFISSFLLAQNKNNNTTENEAVSIILFETEEDCTKYNVKTAPNALLSPASGNAGLLYSKSAYTSISNFILSISTELLVDFTAEKTEEIFGGEITHHVVLFTDPSAYNSPDGSEDNEDTPIRETMKKVAENYRGKVMFVVIPNTEKHITEFFSLESYPTIIMTDSSTGGLLRYSYSPPEGKTTREALAATTESLDTFIKAVFAGEIELNLKSEEILASDTEGSVIAVKGKSFKSLVLESPESVIVEFYAPWCGHCKQLAPVWEELGDKESMKKIGAGGVSVMKMDATENEIDAKGVEIESFPTIYLFKKGEKSEPVLFDGSRDSVEEIEMWIRAELLGDDGGSGDGEL
jgi:protein disulfide isomerase